ncbi:MAG: hypothetical protein ACTSWW_01010 [Promethearchaeota archaeon]
MQIFQVQGNGEIHEILSTEKPIKDLLESKECYILCDDDVRIVYLWKGNEARVRSKFIGARMLQDVRSQVGLNYSSISMDEDEILPGEYPEYQNAIQGARTDGFAREIRDEGEEVKFQVGGGPGGKPRKHSQFKKSTFNSKIQQTGPIYQGGTEHNAYISEQEKRNNSPAYSEAQLEKIISVLDENGIPAGYMRELVIIGDKSYSVTEKVQTIFGVKSIEIKLEPVDSLPEGVFFAEGYVPRVLVQNRTVVAIEFLKKL